MFGLFRGLFGPAPAPSPEERRRFAVLLLRELRMGNAQRLEALQGDAEAAQALEGELRRGFELYLERAGAAEEARSEFLDAALEVLTVGDPQRASLLSPIVQAATRQR